LTLLQNYAHPGILSYRFVLGFMPKTRIDSREARDPANEKVAVDPRMADLIDSSNSGFDAKRMAYGGFQSLGLSSNGTNGHKPFEATGDNAPS
jgi:hypothetical protein